MGTKHTAKGAKTIKVGKLTIARETVKDLSPNEAAAVRGVIDPPQPDRYRKTALC